MSFTIRAADRTEKRRIIMLRRAVLCASVVVSLGISQCPFAFGQDARPLRSAADLHISAALDDRVSLDFDDQPLSDAVDFLHQQHKISIQLDYKALSDAGIGTDTPINIHLQDVSLRSALGLLLDQLDLSYLVRDGYLLITSKTESENNLLTRIYPVGDLIANSGDLRAPTKAVQITDADFHELINAVTATVAPTSWDEVGGPGSIQAAPGSKAVVVWQTLEAHEELAHLFAVLRRARDKQVAAARAVVQTLPKKPSQPVWTVKVYRLVPQNTAAAGGAGSPPSGGGMFAVEDAAGHDNKEAAPAATPPAAQPSAPTAADPRAPGNTGKANNAAPSVADTQQLDTWAKEIAALLPQMVAPESWQGPGKGAARAAAASIVVRQTEELHQQIAKLLQEIIPDHLGKLPPTNEASARLAVPGPQLNWPCEAEGTLINREAELEKALEQKVDLELKDTPLGDFLATIKQDYRVPVLIDQKALSDAGVGTDVPISRDVRGLTLRAALKLVLRDLDLTYVFRNEVLFITSRVEEEQMLTSKVYPVFDLVVRSPDAPPVGPAVDYQPLIRGLTSTIAPVTWDEVGGPGAVTPFANSGALVVEQTTEIHEEIADYLQALREVGAAQK
jgi:hypothetical protein